MLNKKIVLCLVTLFIPTLVLAAETTPTSNPLEQNQPHLDESKKAKKETTTLELPPLTPAQKILLVVGGAAITIGIVGGIVGASIVQNHEQQKPQILCVYEGADGQVIEQMVPARQDCLTLLQQLKQSAQAK